ncbi:hypothetical protein [Aliidiomarina celeris]|uniref:hypothetical protein n=1 Tax=Aliidiomarina celeris TaxID=2249428 RepID=UPI000DEA1E64|nr:hypothetical protein [Aliidiomarina celeris]
MLKSFRLFWTTILLMLLSIIYHGATVAGEPSCESYEGRTFVSCLADYSYATERFYFNSDTMGEQSFVAYTAVKKSTGEVVGASFDFVAQCSEYGLCSQEQEDFLASYFSEFRTAIANNTLYTYVVQNCDSTEQVCCDDNNCNQVKHHQNNQGSLVSSYKFQWQWVKEVVQSAAQELGVQVVNLAANTLLSNREFANNVATDGQIIIVQINGDSIVCKYENDFACPAFDGEVFQGGAEFHNVAQQDVYSLGQFIFDYFSHQQQSCTTSMTCHQDNTCSVVYACQ